MARTRLASAEEAKATGLYFADPKTRLQFIPSGCKLLDCVLGGGWPKGRVVNVVGDKSTGKTLLAIEAAANAARTFPKDLIKYAEAEAAFEEGYAGALGMPLDRVDFGDPEKRLHTVEDFYEELFAFAAKCRKAKVGGFYILDSLDALSDKAELERTLGDATYGTGKAKALSEMFRRLVREIEEANVTLMIISQVRDKIGVTFGDKNRRSGGRALDFYASIVLYLSHLETISRTIKGVKRATGVRVKAKCKKNKVGLPFRDCEFDVRFGYGIDDFYASLDWLVEIKRLDVLVDGTTYYGWDFGAKAGLTEFSKVINELSDEEYRAFNAGLQERVEQVWRQIDADFLPTRHKY